MKIHMYAHHIILIAVIALTACSGAERARRDEPFADNRSAQQLFTRAQQELESFDITPALRDILLAERLCEQEELKREIKNFRRNLFNHLYITTAVENPVVLKYVVLYTWDDVYYPVENLPIRFSFLRGDGIMENSVTTNTLGTAETRIERISSMRRKIIVEAVPSVAIENEPYELKEFEKTFVFSRKKISPGEPELGDVIVESVHASIGFIDRLIKNIFGPKNENE